MKKQQDAVELSDQEDAPLIAVEFNSCFPGPLEKADPKINWLNPYAPASFGISLNFFDVSVEVTGD